MPSGNWVTVAQAASVPPGQVRVVEAGGQRLALCNVSGTFYAVDDLCTHDNGPLGEGTLEGTAIECPRHGARFDVTSGAVLNLPAPVPIRTYPTRVTNGEVQVAI